MARGEGFEGKVKIVEVNLGERSYPILIGQGLLKQVGQLLRGKGAHCAVVIGDVNALRFWGEGLTKSLKEAFVEHIVLSVPSGERYKGLTWAKRLWDELAERKVDRGWWIIAFGGGMVGDLAGFVASSYMRGLPFVQVPTTLLAQIDAGIGGKVGINHPRGKNLLGFFYQPLMVINDPSLLHTLSPRQYKNGFAEVIKYGAIRDEELFRLIEEKRGDIRKRKGDVLEKIVERCSRIKAEYVAKDEKDTKDIRAELNFGHTIGHIIERESRFRLLHGEAVALGMIFAGIISHRLGYLSREDLARLFSLIKNYRLPTRMPSYITSSQITNALPWDKKVREGKLAFVLLRRIGEAFVCKDVPLSLIEEVARELCGR